MEKGLLYLVPTPIGNLKDMTYRAVEILKTVYRIYAEDTRTSKPLLKHYDIETPCFSYHKFNEKQRVDEIISSISNGLSIAIISDAGSPGISDPSNILVKHCIEHGITICPLPGATAFVPAITASGFNSEHFFMFGFLPQKHNEMDKLLNQIKDLPIPVIFYESPHRISETLRYFFEKLGDRDVCVARELTKLYESWYRNKLSYFINNEEIIKTKGEFVFILGPKILEIVDDDFIINKIQTYSDNLSKKDLSRLIAEEYNVSKKRVYELSLRIKTNEGE